LKHPVIAIARAVQGISVEFPITHQVRRGDLLDQLRGELYARGQQIVQGIVDLLLRISGRGADLGGQIDDRVQRSPGAYGIIARVYSRPPSNCIRSSGNLWLQVQCGFIRIVRSRRAVFLTGGDRTEKEGDGYTVRDISDVLFSS
jgi:hypothetical protein